MRITFKSFHAIASKAFLSFLCIKLIITAAGHQFRASLYRFQPFQCFNFLGFKRIITIFNRSQDMRNYQQYHPKNIAQNQPARPGHIRKNLAPHHLEEKLTATTQLSQRP